MIIHNGDHAQFEKDHAHVTQIQRPDWPLPSFDAHDWAKEFCRIAKRIGHDIDEEWMVAWFANALMRGFDEGVSRRPETWWQRVRARLNRRTEQ